MYKYEITKYNPKFRGEKNGVRTYLKDDWISIEDIGGFFCGKLLSKEKYKEIENNYVKSIEIIMKYIGIDYVIIDKIERWSMLTFSNDHVKNHISFYDRKMLELHNVVQNKDKLDIRQTINFCRLCLRNTIWANIFYPRKLKIFIGYDYLMSVHTSKSLEKIISQIENMGLFVERY